MEFVGYIALVAMGAVLGLLGGGGSILTVPIMVYLFGVNPIEATMSSLFIVGITALGATFQYAKKREVQFTSGIKFTLASFAGVYFSRSFVLPRLPEILFSSPSLKITSADLVLLSFAVLMIGASLAMIGGKQEPQSKTRNSFNVRAILQGVAVGAITGFVGAGGGFLIVPALANLIGLPMRIAVGTSLFVIAANSLFGFIVSNFHGAHVNWSPLLIATTLAMMGSAIGVKLSQRVSEGSLRKSFGYFVLTVGTLIILERALS